MNLNFYFRLKSQKSIVRQKSEAIEGPNQKDSETVKVIITPEKIQTGKVSTNWINF